MNEGSEKIDRQTIEKEHFELPIKGKVFQFWKMYGTTTATTTPTVAAPKPKWKKIKLCTKNDK